jgi:Cytochrome c oxidase assembly protein CtaG/Cox11
MSPKFRSAASVLAAGFLLILPPVYLLSSEGRNPGDEPVRVLAQYLKRLYARDFSQAYRLISARDQKVKTAKVYVRERGPFNGFASEVASKLADLIQVQATHQRIDGDRLHMKLAMKVPDATNVAPLLLNWDEEALNALPSFQRRKILAELENRRRAGKIKMVEGEEEFTLIKERNEWKILLDWAAGVRISFAARVNDFPDLEAHALVKETVARPNELFTIAYKVKNRSSEDFFARIVHNIEPRAAAGHLDIVECALLLPVRVLPGEEQEYASTYLVRGDLPEGTKELKVTYEFKVER